MKKEKVVIGKQLEITAGKRHAWYEARIGDKVVRVRKPLDPKFLNNAPA